MSGPIVRKYGFANFEKIFGAREVPHGAPEGGKEDAKADPARSPGAPSPDHPTEDPGTTPSEATEPQKESADSAKL